MQEEKAFSVEQIVAVKQVELGWPVAEVIRKLGISEQIFYRWEEQYVGMETDQMRQMKQLQEENSRPKRPMGNLHLPSSERTCQFIGHPSGRIYVEDLYQVASSIVISMSSRAQ